MKDHIAQLIHQALVSLVEQGQLPAEVGEQIAADRISIDRTRDKSHGDLASNIALTLAKKAKQPPRAVAQLIIDHLPASDKLAQTAIAGPAPQS